MSRHRHFPSRHHAAATLADWLRKRRFHVTEPSLALFPTLLAEQALAAVAEADIVEAVYEKVGGFSKKESADLVDLVFETMKETMGRVEKIKISGFGNFTLRDKRPRKGRNPQTGDDIQITARRVLTLEWIDGTPLSDRAALEAAGFDLKLLARDAEEFTFFDLQKQIADLKSKGIDATSYEVDLHTKLAFPLISPLMVLLAIPFALRRQLTGNISLSFGTAMSIAFGYWVLSGFCISLGHSGALPSWAAGWTVEACGLTAGTLRSLRGTILSFGFAGFSSRS